MVTLAERVTLIRTVKMHFTILKCKAELDQLKNGLSMGVREALCSHSDLLSPLFISTKATPLTSGMLHYHFVLFIDHLTFICLKRLFKPFLEQWFIHPVVVMKEKRRRKRICYFWTSCMQLRTTTLQVLLYNTVPRAHNCSVHVL